MAEQRKPYIIWDVFDLQYSNVKATIEDQNIDEWMLNGSSFLDLWEESTTPSKFLRAVADARRTNELENHLLQVFVDDPDMLTWAWTDMLSNLDDLMKELNPDEKDWYIGASGLGWQRRSGEKFVSGRDSAKDFLHGVLPKTDNTFKIYKDGEGKKPYGFTIVNSHHDAMGEVYHVEKATYFEDISKADLKGALEAAKKAVERAGWEDERAGDAFAAYLSPDGKAAGEYHFNSDTFDPRSRLSDDTVELYDYVSGEELGAIRVT